jgi:hypothetical protein
MKVVSQSMPLSIDPLGKDQSLINRQLTEMIRQLWLRLSKKEADTVTMDYLSSQMATLVINDNIVRITLANSPYTALSTDRSIYADTDSGAITVRLPPGLNKARYTIKNCGASGNDVTLTPYGAELLFGLNASEIVADGEVIDVQYETVEGWR